MTLILPLQAALWLLLLGYALAALFYIPYYWMADLKLIGAITLVLLAVILGLFLRLPTIPDWRDLTWNAAWRWVAGLVLLGIALRTAYVLAIPPVQLSDAASYVELAVGLIEHGKYEFSRETGTLYAFRPPGYPLVLAALYWIFGQADWVPLLLNLVCFAATCATTMLLCDRLLGSRRLGVIACAALAIWPGAIAGAGLALSEPLTLALLTTSTYAVLEGRRGRTWGLALAGLSLGLCILVRPSLMLLPVVWITFAIVDSGNRRRALTASLGATLMAALVVAPWSWRNYQVFDEFVAVSTNGGSVFYRANNPWASGGFTERGERDLDHYLHDELLWNSIGYKWGVEWIKSNPLGFAMLGVKKQAIFTASDDSYLYWSIARAYDETGLGYRLGCWIANGWWFGMLLLLPVAIWRHRGLFLANLPLSVMVATTLYLVSVHSVFESQPRHHVPISAFLIAFAAMAVFPRGAFDGGTRVGGTTALSV